MIIAAVKQCCGVNTTAHVVLGLTFGIISLGCSFLNSFRQCLMRMLQTVFVTAFANRVRVVIVMGP